MDNDLDIIIVVDNYYITKGKLVVIYNTDNRLVIPFSKISYMTFYGNLQTPNSSLEILIDKDTFLLLRPEAKPSENYGYLSDIFSRYLQWS